MTHLIYEVIERHSFVLRMPEEVHAMVFRAHWNEWTTEERAVFNDWRVRTGRKLFLAGPVKTS